MPSSRARARAPHATPTLCLPHCRCRVHCRHQRRSGRRPLLPSRVPPLLHSARQWCSASGRRRRRPERWHSPRWRRQLGRRRGALRRLPGLRGPRHRPLRQRQALSQPSAMTKAVLRGGRRPPPSARPSLPLPLCPSLAAVPARPLPARVAARAMGCRPTRGGQKAALSSCQAASGLPGAACWAARPGQAAQAGKAATASLEATTISIRLPMASGACQGGAGVCRNMLNKSVCRRGPSAAQACFDGGVQPCVTVAAPPAPPPPQALPQRPQHPHAARPLWLLRRLPAHHDCQGARAI